jgi:hypothetical protein
MSRLKLALKLICIFVASVVALHMFAFVASAFFGNDLALCMLVGANLLIAILTVCATPFILIWLFIVMTIGAGVECT